MDRNKRENGQEKEFQFLQEKVASKWKKRGKKFLFLTTGTVILAVIFGLIARYTFLVSEDWLIKLLGLKEEERTQIEFPSNTPIITPSNTPTPTPIPSPTPTPVVKPEQKEPVIVEQKVEATAKDYVKMMSDIRKIADQAAKSLVTVTAIESGMDWSDKEYETETSTSGVIIGENNVDILILTQLNEVRGATRITVTFLNQTTEALLWNYDTDYNLAILAVSLKDLNETTLETIKTATLGESYLVTTGIPVLALGNPNGYTGSVELGMVTKKGLYTSVVDNRFEFFQMNMINYERSGGIIVNFDGEVIGLISQTLKGESKVFTAVGISKLKPIIEQLANKTDRIYFGIIPEELPKEVLKEAELSYGIYVKDVMTDSPAFQAGIRRGDIIASINDTDMVSVGTFTPLLKEIKPEEIVTVKVKRLVKRVYKEIEFSVTLTKKEH